MALEVVKVFKDVHEGTIIDMAFDRAKREVYSCSDAENVIKVRASNQPVGWP